MVGFTHLREKMVEDQIIARGVKDERVIAAMKKVERHRFVDEGLRHRAYKDFPLPIGQQQTISQPYIVALMSESLELKGDEKVLEIGTGSGYQAAILAELCEKVFTIERDQFLGKKARSILDKLGYTNINIRIGDGSIGWSEFAPFDRIMVTCGAPMIPQQVIHQLRENGRMVIPVGDMNHQKLNIIKKEKGRYSVEEGCACAFVPLIGQNGWNHEIP